MRHHRFLLRALSLAAFLAVAPSVRAEIVTLNAPDGFVTDATLAAGGGVVAAAWVEATAAENRLMLAWSRGGPLDNVAIVATTATPPGELALAAGADGFVHLAWSVEEGDPARPTLHYTLAEPDGLSSTDSLATLIPPSYASSPEIAPVADDLSSWIVWTQGSGSFQQIAATHQFADGTAEEWLLAGAESPGNFIYPQVFALKNAEALFAWTELGSESRIVGYRRSAEADAEWRPLDADSLARLPSERIPILFRDAADSVGALYIDEGARGGDAVYYQPLRSGAERRLVSGRLPGTASLPGADYPGEGMRPLLYWATEDAGEQVFEAGWLQGDGTVAPVATTPLAADEEPTPAGIVAGDSLAALSGLDLAANGDQVHLVWWSTVEAGGRGDLSYVTARLAVPVLEAREPEPPADSANTATELP